VSPLTQPQHPRGEIIALVRGTGKEPAMVLPILTGIIGSVSRSHAP
jgi:hypothetical protein